MKLREISYLVDTISVDILGNSQRGYEAIFSCSDPTEDEKQLVVRQANIEIIGQRFRTLNRD